MVGLALQRRKGLFQACPRTVCNSEFAASLQDVSCQKPPWLEFEISSVLKIPAQADGGLATQGEGSSRGRRKPICTLALFTVNSWDYSAESRAWQGGIRLTSSGSCAHKVEDLKGGLIWAAGHGEGPLGVACRATPVRQGKFSLLFPLSRTEVPAAKEALKKHGREARQGCGKLGEEQAEHYPCWLCSRGGNLIVILVSSWDAALIPAFAISCQAQAPNLPLLPSEQGGTAW